jgi:uncharacterized coiled-coil DUF342 family protein
MPLLRYQVSINFMVQLELAEKRKLKKFVKEMEKQCQRLSRDRDKFRTILSEYNDVLENTNQGIDDIRAGIDKLSELL